MPALARGDWLTRRGNATTMFVFSKRSGQRGRVRFYWWPLVLSIVLLVLITLAINR